MDEQAANLVIQIQQIGYQILCDIDKYCAENSLTYYLSGGSCLGAVRHHGFIPWDEDLDIMMPRKDYEKLIDGFGMSYSEKYCVGSLETTPQWERTYTRIWDLDTELIQTKSLEMKMGIYVDVFPIDGLPDQNCGQKIFFARIKILNVLRNAAVRTDFYEYERYRILKKGISHIAKPIGARKFAIRINRLAQKYPFETSKYVGASMAVHYGAKEKIERESMEKGVRVPFETAEFPIPIGYDRYLSNLYGDYMTIPRDAEEQGHSHLSGWSVKINNDIKSGGGGDTPLVAGRDFTEHTFERRCA